MECWAALVEARGGLLTREELQRRVWGEAVLEESNLAHAIAALRKAIDPAPDGRSYIETVPRTGYRLIQPVSELPEDAAPAPAEATPEPPPRAEAAMAKPRTPSWILVGPLAAALLAGAGFLVARAIESANSQEDAVRLTRSAIDGMRHGLPSKFSEAKDLLDKARVLDPELPLAKAATAELSARAGVSSFEHAVALAKEAVKSDPTCTECRGVLGFILSTRLWDWKGAKAQLEPAAAQIDASSQVHVWFGQLLTLTGRFEEAHRQADLAIRKDPGRPGAFVMKGVACYVEERWDEAARLLGQAESLDPRNHNPDYWRYRIAMMRNDVPAAAAGRAISQSKYSGFSPDKATQSEGEMVARAEKGGKQAVASHWLAQTGAYARTRAHQSYERASWKMWLGDAAGAMAELEEAEKARPFNLVYVGVDPIFKPLRGTARFRSLLARLGLT